MPIREKIEIEDFLRRGGLSPEIEDVLRRCKQRLVEYENLTHFSENPYFAVLQAMVDPIHVVDQNLNYSQEVIVS